MDSLVLEGVLEEGQKIVAVLEAQGHELSLAGDVDNHMFHLRFV
jgi:hypothetical protein